MTSIILTDSIKLELTEELTHIDTDEVSTAGMDKCSEPGHKEKVRNACARLKQPFNPTTCVCD